MKPDTGRSRLNGVWSAVLAGLLVRVFLTTALFDWTSVPTMYDDGTYARFAEGLLRTGQLESHHFPVGYPLFVALMLKLTGGSYATVRITHVLLGLALIVVVARIAERLYGRPAGVLAAWVTALYPPLVFMTGRVMSETLFITLLTAGLLEFLVNDQDMRLWRSALAGGVFALAAIVRSNLVLMVPLIPFWQLMRAAIPLKTRLANAVVSTAVMAMVLVLPGLYFLSTQGEFVPFATNAGQTFYGANNQLADGGWVQVENHPELLKDMTENDRRSATAYSRAQYRLGVQWIREHPGQFVGLLPNKLLNAWVPGFQSSMTSSGSRLAFLVLTFSTGLLLAGAIAGRLLVRPAQRDGILLAVPAVYTVMSLVFYGNPRIGLFCAPVLIVYLSSLVKRLGLRTERSLAG